MSPDANRERWFAVTMIHLKIVVTEAVVVVKVQVATVHAAV
jgi:hypothetical protein